MMFKGGGGKCLKTRLNTSVEEREWLEERYSGTGWRQQLPRAPKGGGKEGQVGEGAAKK